MPFREGPIQAPPCFFRPLVASNPIPARFMIQEPRDPPNPSSGRFLRLIAAACLVSPIFFISVFFSSDIFLETALRAVTPFDGLFADDARNVGGGLSGPQRANMRRVYRERLAVHALVAAWPGRVKAPVLALVLSAFSLWAARRFFRPKTLPEKGGYGRAALVSAGFLSAAFLLASGFALPLKSPRIFPAASAFSAWCGLIFFVNFFLAERLPAPGVKASLLLFFTTGPSHFIAPAFHARLAASAFFPKSQSTASIISGAGRAAACLLGFVPAAFLFFHLAGQPVSPGVTGIIPLTDLYGVFINPKTQSLLITRKHTSPERPNFAVSLEEPLAPGGLFHLPSLEVEDLAVDPDSGLIFHVDRKSKNLLTIDSETLKVTRAAPLAAPFTGSARTGLLKEAGRLFVAWENGGLSAVDLKSQKVIKNLSMPCNPNMATDGKNGRLYIHLYLSGQVISMDAKTLQVLASAPSPKSDERPVISEKRRELYIPDIARGRIWVYSIPDLALLRKLPAQTGVRALASDDENGILLAASIVSGDLRIMNPETGRVLSSFHVGPYCRRLALDPQRRRAFITLTQTGLFMVDY